jgi:hypothetical protein
MFQLSRSKVDNRMATDVANGRTEVAAVSVSGSRVEDRCADLRVLGLSAEASWEQILAAPARLVSDLTPGDGADHGNVALAERLLDEVNRAFDALRARSSVA